MRERKREKANMGDRPSSLASDAKKLRSPSFLKRGHEHTANLPQKSESFFAVHQRQSAVINRESEREKGKTEGDRESLFLSRVKCIMSPIKQPRVLR